MIDLVQLRREPDVVKAALARRGVSLVDLDEAISLDIEHRRLLQETERFRAEVKDLSRQVGEARRAGPGRGWRRGVARDEPGPG
jgi:seryl-tRNA synthetase